MANNISHIIFSVAACRLIIFVGITAVLILLLLPFNSLNRRPDNLSQYEEPYIPSSFYDDPSLSYTIEEQPINNWDERRQQWQLCHPSFCHKNRIFMVSGSQPGRCPNPHGVGDHLLLRFFKNKADYCRLHGIELFYNDALLHPNMSFFWAKIPVLRSAMVAHPEADWIWWVDSDAVFTDMEFELPIEKYDNYNLILYGWPKEVFEARSWTGLNAGVFLMRNCQWSLDFLERWSRMGPQSPEYDRWGKIQQSLLKDKLFPDSDDQAGIIYLLVMEKDKWGDKIYLENEYEFQGYWVPAVKSLEKLSSTYSEMERRDGGLRRRRAEKMALAYGRIRGKYLAGEGENSTRPPPPPPLITHFTGCQPCSGNHNKMYSWESCWEGMQMALNFADDQVMRAYGFGHDGLVNSSGGVKPLPFDYPALR